MRRAGRRKLGRLLYASSPDARLGTDAGHPLASATQPARRRILVVSNLRSDDTSTQSAASKRAMNLTRKALANPAGVTIGVAIAAVFGLYALAKLPIQLFPDIEKPQLSIFTNWRAAAPQEVESEILEPQEEVLQGLPGLKEISAQASQGSCSINLTFGLETDMQKTLIEVISRFNRLPALPNDATPPIIQLGGGGPGGGDELIWFFVQLLPGTPGPVEDYQKLVEEVIKPRFESVPGVAGIQLMAGQAEQVQIIFDPYRAAELGISIPGVAAQTGRANDVSGGFIDIGRRQYTLRFAGRFSPQQLEQLILEWRDGSPVRLGDIANIEVQRGDRTFFSVQNGNPAMAIRVDRENGANILQTLSQIKAVAEELRQGPLAEVGLDLRPSFDASVFIHRAIALVAGNLIIGILLSVGILWWFLRRLRATLLVAIAIPLSLLGTFVVLFIGGRSLNVISLAGLAFAVGMVLDAAIVVLENIVRLRERGQPADDASDEGASQVWGALLASTATTVAIFLPVIFLKDVEGQLFADLALTIAIAVVISLLVAVVILPVAAQRWLTGGGLKDTHQHAWHRWAARLIRWTDTPARRAAWIVALMSIPVIVSLALIPQLDYLPPVKRDAVDAFFNFPPGANPKTIDDEIVQVMMQRLDPYMKGDRQPALRNYYAIIFPGGGTIGVRAKDQNQVKELERIIRDEVTANLPDTQSFVYQGNLFGGFQNNRSIAMHLQATDVQALMAAARQGMGKIHESIPGATVRPFPALELAEPQLSLVPRDERILEVGWNRATVAQVVRALGDGVFVGEHFDGEKRLDIILKASPWATPEELAAMPLATPSGTVAQLGELVDIERTVGPTQLRRIGRRRTVTLSVVPPDGISLEEAVTALRQDVEPELRAMLPSDGSILYGGSADSLETAVANMLENFLMALVILFLLMSALFRSMRDSILVVLAIPLATVGGVLSLRLMNLFTFQPLDLLTMIGFIILLGLVVNNAILLVHQTRQAERQGSERRRAVQDALTMRMRPIFMSTLTSIFGMLPLILMPGTGSAIYRGLAVVIVGGMSVSTIFTLILLPCFLRLGEPPRAARHDNDDALIASNGLEAAA